MSTLILWQLWGWFYRRGLFTQQSTHNFFVDCWQSNFTLVVPENCGFERFSTNWSLLMDYFELSPHPQFVVNALVQQKAARARGGPFWPGRTKSFKTSTEVDVTNEDVTNNCVVVRIYFCHQRYNLCTTLDVNWRIYTEGTFIRISLWRSSFK